MSTVQEAIDRRAGLWCLWVEIAGLGIGAGVYKLCTSAPRFAAADPTWLPVLKSIPTEIPADIDPLGGVLRAGVLDFTAVDVQDVLTDLLRFDADPVGELLTVLDDTATDFFVRSGAGFTVGQVIHIDHEAMVVDTVTGPGVPGSLKVVRGALGTRATDHAIQTPIRGWVQKVQGRDVRLYMAPEDADSIAERVDLGDFTVRKLHFSSGFTGFRFVCASGILGLKRRLGDALQGHYRVIYVAGDRTLSLERVLTSRSLLSFNVWAGDAGRAYFELAGQELVVAIGTGVADGTGQLDQIVIERRGALGTAAINISDKASDEGGLRVVRPLVASTEDGLGSFRFIPPTAADQESRADPAVEQSDHFIDIMLCLMMSSRRASDGLELANYEPGENNYSTLPLGYGAGIRSDRIDWPEWMALKARTPNWRFPGFILREPSQLGEVITKHFLRPLGIYMVIHQGKIRPVLPRLPFEGQTAPVFDASNILGDIRPATPAHIGGGYDASTEKRAVVLKPRDPSGAPTTIVITSADFSGELGGDDEPGPEDVIEIDLPGVRTNQGGVTAFFEELAVRRLYRFAKPAPAFTLKADLATRAVPLGGLAALTFPAIPNPKTGTRGIADVLMTVISKALNLDLQAPGFDYEVLGYGGGADVGLISPAARITGFVGATNTVTISGDRYTATDGDVLGLPTTDAELFRAGMVVKLIDASGVDAHVTTQTVVADGAAGAVQLDGGFGVSPINLYMVLEDYDAARTEDQDTYVAFADRNTRTVGASSRAPWAHGEQ